VNSPEYVALKKAKRALAKVGYGNWDATKAVRDAERALAASLDEAWAEVIDLGVEWSAGAPRPHLISDGSTAILLCLSDAVASDWDRSGTEVTISPENRASTLIEITFRSCYSTKFGSPGDEVLDGHPLYGRGLTRYSPHKVNNSEWIKELEAIQATHSEYRGPGSIKGDHYALAFKDETFEAVAGSVRARAVEGSLGDLLAAAAHSLTSN
jgi:stress-induced morphogen